ncbi:H/ACA ribonucleoprotein complex non-core subunit NAF1 isoform X2 [Paroedura picta]|uniref:H/ACA ribonucleoprotein complex non-core subunit NAF1 isoform X2 n=1 Tax=Paroedura picta TaxID=143630 RepID=UPI004055F724
MEVTEKLGTLSVAGEAAEENVSLPSGKTHPEGHGGAAAERLQQAGPSKADPDGGLVDGQIPGPQELPAADSHAVDGPAVSSRQGTRPTAQLASASVAAEERSQGSQAPAEGDDRPGLQPCPEEGEGALPPPSELSRPSSALALAEGPGEGAEEREQGVDQGLGDACAVKERPLADGGDGGATESDSDTDTDSSTSVSSTSSCSPLVSEEDGQQYKNDDSNSHSVGKKGEPPEKTLPVEDPTIFLPESVELMPLGKVSSIIEHLVIVESLNGLPPVNEDSVLFKQDHYSIGKVSEVFGPVSHPFYTLQFKSPEHIEAKGIKVHDEVYFAPSVESFTQYVFPEQLKQEKGSDASWKNDEEPPPEALDFSDDEKEKAAKQKKSQNVRRKKFRSQDESNKNGIQYQPKMPYPSDNSTESPGRELNPSFSTGTFTRAPVPPRSFRWQAEPPQHYCSDYTEFQDPAAFYHHQTMGYSGWQQESFPPPPFGTLNNEATRYALPPPPWGWPQTCVQNAYDPLLTMLALPPPPPPPMPPLPTAFPNNSNPF